MRGSTFLASLVLGFLASNPAAAVADPVATASQIGLRLLDADHRATAAFERAYGETAVVGRLGENRCFFMRVPGSWHLIGDELGPLEASGGEAFSFRATGSEAQLEIVVHDAETFGRAPGSNLVVGYAASLQRDYEGLLGRPALGTALESADISGAYRWRATWADNNFDNAARALSLERFILQLSSTAVIELSAGGIVPGAFRDELVRRALSTLELWHGTACRS